MLRKQTGQVTFDELLEAPKMVRIERAIGADRQSDAVERQRIAFPDGRQIAVRRASRAHVIFRMNLEEADIGPGLDDRAVVLGLEADASAGRNAVLYERGWKRHGNLRGDVGRPQCGLPVQSAIKPSASGFPAPSASAWSCRCLWPRA